MKSAYVDLHLHLDGAITPSIARRLAKMTGVALPKSDEELEIMLSVPEDCEDLNAFLKCFALPLSLLQTEQSIEEAVYLVQEQIKENGVIYAEIRFAPQLHGDQGVSQEQAIRAALKGLKRSDLACNLILCCMRGNDTKESNLKTVKLASKYLVEDEGVVALDLAGAEGLFPTADYEEEFRLAKKLGVPFTIHAGEADGASSIKKALEFGAARIGHGVRAYEDPELLERLVREKICLELCPTSNRQTKAVENMDQYPLRSFIEAGICVTINTDDMAISRTDIQHEFAYIRNKFRISEEEEKLLLINAVKSAFTSNNRKEKLLRQIQE